MLLGGSAAAFSSVTNHRVQATLSRSSLSETANLLAVYARVRGNGIGGPPALWWIKGVVYGKQYERNARPLFQVTGVSLNKVTTGKNGGVILSIEEGGYYADLETGEFMDSWTNPVTGASTQPKHYKMFVSHSFAMNGDVEHDDSTHRTEAYGGISPVEISGDTLWVEENHFSRTEITGPSSQPTSAHVNVGDSLITFQARVEDLLSPEGSYVPATLAYEQTNSWASWLKMGDYPGVQLWQLKGRKLADPEEIPAQLKNRLRTDHPNFI
jgi:hypothetical protein